MSLLEHIARSVGLSAIDHKLSIDDVAQLIIDQTQQLSDVRTASRDRQQTLIQTLQHKLKSLKERLDLKVSNQPINRSVYRSVYLPDETAVKKAAPGP